MVFAYIHTTNARSVILLRHRLPVNLSACSVLSGLLYLSFGEVNPTVRDKSVTFAEVLRDMNRN
jgi:hypothetical protein